eukprot:2336718-Amphidinium_carterae.1
MADNPAISALMAQQGPNTVWCQWFRDLAHLHHAAANELGHLPVPCRATQKEWICFIVLAQNKWQDLLRRLYTAPSQKQTRKAHQIPAHVLTDVYHEEPNIVQIQIDHNEVNAHEQLYVDNQAQPPIDLNLVHAPVLQPAATTDPTFNADVHCHLCFKAFGTVQGLLMHKRIQHGVASPISLRIRGTTCHTCGAELLNRKNLMEHYWKRPMCALLLMADVNPRIHAGNQSTQCHFSARHQAAHPAHGSHLDNWRQTCLQCCHAS